MNYKLYICLLAAALLLAPWPMRAQQADAPRRAVSGTVTEGGAPLVGATVMVKGTTQAAMTGADGRYALPSVPTGATLVFTFLGKATREVVLGSQPTVDVDMENDAQALEDVVVVAYGTAKKESMVGSAGTVSSKQLSRRVATNVTKALDGQVAGIQVTSGSGQPGSGASIRVRGFGSINSSNEPLYVVDGAPYPGDIASINVADIASITVLKDASAGALYGARGANGVILITTKRGREGSLQVSARAVWGVTSRAIPQYDLVDAREFIEASYMMYRNDAMFTEGLGAEQAGRTALANMSTGNRRLFGDGEQYNPYNMPLAALIDPLTGKVNPAAQLRYSQNWMDEVTATLPLRQEYSLNLTGGDSRTRYFASFGYLNENGLLKTTSYERFSARLNADSQVKPWAKIGGALSYTIGKSTSRPSSGTGVSNVWYSAQLMAPIYPVFEVDEQGAMKHDETGATIYDYGKNRPMGASPNSNPVALLFEDNYYSNVDHLDVNAYTELGLNEPRFGLAQGLTFKVSISATNENSRSTTYYNPLHGNAAPPINGRLTKGSSRGLVYTFNQIAGYEHDFGEHNVSFIVGHEYFRQTTNGLSAGRTGFPFPGITELGPGTTLDGNSSSQADYAIESVLSRLKYSYGGGRYNFEASLRTDGSSRFHRNTRWGTFWSVGANWRLSEEAFMRSQRRWLNNLSLRLSYGVQGNDNVGSYYAWQSYYDLSWANAGNNGSVVSSLESRDLMWEKNANLNFGIEARLLDRVSLTADVFRRTTSDMLLAVPMALSLGFDSYMDNIGSMTNTGFELALSVELLKMRRFDWRITTNLSLVRNRIAQLVTEQPIVDGRMIYKVGEPIYSWYLPRSAGVDPGTGKLLYWVWDKKDPVTGERQSEPYISSDVSKATASREPVGSKQPDFGGSVGTEVRLWDCVDVSVLTSYSVGGRTIDDMYYGFTHPGYPGEVMHRDVLRAWQKPGDVTDVPRLELASGNVSTQADLISASFFALRNVTVGYSLPEAMLRHLPFESLRIYAAADNVFTLSALRGFDPQGSLTSSLSYNYVPVRTVSVGLMLTF